MWLGVTWTIKWTTVCTCVWCGPCRPSVLPMLTLVKRQALSWQQREEEVSLKTKLALSLSLHSIYLYNHVDARKPAAMYVSHQFQLKDRRRCYRSMRKFLGSTDYRQDLKEVSYASVLPWIPFRMGSSGCAQWWTQRSRDLWMSLGTSFLLQFSSIF